MNYRHMIDMNSLPMVRRRLLLGLIVSLVIHVAMVSGIAPKRPITEHAYWQPLHVELHRERERENVAEVVYEAPSEVSALPPAPEATREALHKEVPQPAPATTRAPIQFALPLDTYYTSQQVDVRAEPINEVDLIYPKLAYQKRIAGKVQLRLFINEHGAIDEIALVHGTPPGTFEEAAVTATLALHFKPAILNGRNVKSQKTIEVVFDPYETINTP
jgi:TonB family protein